MKYAPRCLIKRKRYIFVLSSYSKSTALSLDCTLPFCDARKANRAYQPYQHRGDSSDGECDEDTTEFQPNRHQHSLQHQYHRHRRPNHTYQQPGALLNTDTSGTSGNCSDATLTDSELAFTRDATLQLHDGGKSDIFVSIT
ncbi:teneurin-m isoform X1 [Aphis craccivora]|uniref:Teneurin-m isoform X1 n=1 Tax=Aphis craccivora TaxID=307492 RepID=A0A6G0ZRG6_APHCR|nr:teneurin-m isoform X1 [Aphis craccivora]